MSNQAKFLSVLLLVAGLGACSGDGTGKVPSGGDDDAATGDVGADIGPDAGNNGVPDAGNNGVADFGNNGTVDLGADQGTDVGDDVGADPDMTVGRCGNGMIEGAEECDDGNNDANDDCSAECTFTCGDGFVGTNEACDTAIADGMPGACPTSCDDGDACTTGTLQGSACAAECVFGDILACTNGDGCCPSACNSTNDDDCSPVCGNNVQEAGEACDGNCPVTCDDSMACTTDTMTGDPSTCDVMCSNTAIVVCVNGDGCCPTGCTSLNDNDCSASCGNNVVEGGESCDGNCPTLADCNDNNVCTTDGLAGSAAQCTAMCTNTTVTTCSATSDGCCPAGCTAVTDPDCVASCGNGTIEGTEECDDGGNVPGDGCDAQCMAESVVFRLTDLDLRDPHVYARLPIFGCSDITNNVPFNLAPPVNQMLQDAIQCDGDCGDAADDDGFLDVSFLLAFRPFSQADAATGALDVHEADCTAPASTTTCTTGGITETTTYTSSTSADCMDVIAGTVYGYTPAIDASTAPCFGSDSITLTVDIGGIIIPLQSVQAGGTYVGNPATTMTDGLLRGFLSETAADGIILPNTIAVVGGMPLSSLLPGGDPPASGTACTSNADCTANGETCISGACSLKNCAGHSDLDVGPNNESGWWFYFNFPASTVTFTP